MLDNPATTAAPKGNLIECLEHWLSTTPDSLVFAWRSDDLLHQETLTYGELLAQARTIGARLQSRYQAGDRAVLLFPPGLEFIVSFFGCLSAGLVAVPICPPRRSRPSPNVDRIVENADPSVVLSTAEYVAHRDSWFGELSAFGGKQWLSARDMIVSAESWDCPSIDDDTLAFLQYTSGTTGTPKGVMVSHGNLASNALTIHNAIGSADHSHRVCWLPLYHDMGLIGAMLQTVFDGAMTTWIAPSTFLRRPLSWLELISQTGASFSGAPDFAYNLCVDRSTPETRERLDLSHWTVASSGAETIRPTTIDRFCKAFAPCGFRDDTFQPGYGLAEATLVVSHLPRESIPVTVHVDTSAISRDEVVAASAKTDETKRLASSGRVGNEQTVAIVDPATDSRCSNGAIGEIWVSGPNVAKGYYGDANATKQTFQARLPGDDRQYLRTGDLGFLLDDQLYVTGRLKELIVIRGRNLYPQDIERAVRECDVRVSSAVNSAFSVELFGGERLVVIQEFGRAHRKTNFEELGEIIRMAIGRECGIEVFDLLFVREGSIPRTTSGKVRRVQCRQDYLEERYQPTARWTDRQHEVGAAPKPTVVEDNDVATTRTEQEIRDWLLQRIGLRLDVAPQRLNEDQAFSEMGLGSLDIVLICEEFEQWLGQRLAPTTVFNYPTIDALAQQLGQTDELCLMPMSTANQKDQLREEVEQLSHRELEDFLAQEMAKLADRRAA